MCALDKVFVCFSSFSSEKENFAAVCESSKTYRKLVKTVVEAEISWKQVIQMTDKTQGESWRLEETAEKLSRPPNKREKKKNNLNTQRKQE